MSKQFAMLSATRRLENHLSRENFKLSKMAESDSVSLSMLKKKVNHHNELVDALNDLFASLTDSPSSLLFPRFNIDFSGGADTAEQGNKDALLEFTPDRQESSKMGETEGSTASIWENDGYETYEAWLADKEAESVQLPDDLSSSVIDALSRHRAQQALNEYSQTSERDIASYLPEDDSPVNVLASENEDVSVTDYSYLDHTVDNVRINSDPMQIAGVKTAVERHGESACKGTDIDVVNFLYQSESSVVDDLIRDDIEQLHTPQAVAAEDNGYRE